MPKVEGTTNRTNNVVTPNPKVIVAAIGIKYWACRDFSNIKADKPPMVVQEVNKTGLSLSHTPDIIASLGLSGFSWSLLSIVATKIMELLKAQGVDDILVTGGGIIPEDDMATLNKIGVGKLFAPGSSIEESKQYIENWVLENR